MRKAWRSQSKVLHWLSVLTVLGIVPVGYLMTTLYGYSIQYPEIKKDFIFSSQLHHTLGFLLLFMTLMRVYFRLRTKSETALEYESTYATAVARILQWSLYFVLIALPVSGWAALSVLADSKEFGETQIWLFHFDNIIPHIVEPKHWSDPSGYRQYAKVHRILIYLGGGLLCVHIGAAIYHHWIKKDQTLVNILPKR